MDFHKKSPQYLMSQKTNQWDWCW